MAIPEALQDNWLLVLLFLLFVGPQAVMSKGNAENLWLFGWIYKRIKDRKWTAFQEEQRIGSAMQGALRDEVKQLRDQLARQTRYWAEVSARQENELRDLRSENSDALSYMALLKRWAYDLVSDVEGVSLRDHPLPPDFDVWREERHH